MKTVKEISALTGVSPRTLHYYDEIGLLRPSAKTEAGYRLYDDSALAVLQKILFLREFQIPLKTIRNLLASPSLEETALLRMQRQLLTAEKERLEALISALDDILKGDNKMDFTIFAKPDLERLFAATAERLPEEMEAAILREYGSLEAWRAHYLERAAREDYQKGCEKLVAMYGSGEAALAALTAPPSRETAAAFGERAAALEREILAHRASGPASPAVRRLAEEYGALMKELYRAQDEGPLMGQVAASLRHPLVRERLDGKYGEGASAFLAEALEAVYPAKS